MIDITENTYKYNLLEVMDYFNIDLKKSEDDRLYERKCLVGQFGKFELILFINS